MIKQAILLEEKNQIEKFLARFDLLFDSAFSTSFYLEDQNQIVATITVSQDIIKDLAVLPDYQGNQYATQLVDHAMKVIYAAGFSSARVFTKAIYIPVFEQLGFTCLVEAKNSAILERGTSGIHATLEGMKATIEGFTHQAIDTLNLGTIVVNCNPVTLGHFGLIEYASKRHDYLVVFVVDEDRSFFTFQERYALLYLAVSSLQNVIMLPSSKYIVSALTFPSYFLKTVEERDQAYAILDVLLFKQYFMPILHLQKRYIGTETEPVMVLYNHTLQTILGDRLVVIQRFLQSGDVISASRVRKCIKEGRLEEALLLVPEATRGLLKQIAMGKKHD